MTQKKHDRLEGELGVFLRQYARKVNPSIDPNDRNYDRKIEQIVKRMPPERLDALMHGTEEEDLDKDPRLFDVIQRLRRKLGRSSFLIVDHWEADREAIGIAKPTDPRVLAHIALTVSPEHWVVHLESPAEPGSDLPYTSAGEFFEQDFDSMVHVIREHLQHDRKD